MLLFKNEEQDSLKQFIDTTYILTLLLFLTQVPVHQILTVKI